MQGEWPNEQSKASRKGEESQEDKLNMKANWQKKPIARSVGGPIPDRLKKPTTRSIERAERPLEAFTPILNNRNIWYS